MMNLARVGDNESGGGGQDDGNQGRRRGSHAHKISEETRGRQAEQRNQSPRSTPVRKIPSEGQHAQSAPVGSARKEDRLARTPLFAARHSDRYERQGIIGEYESKTGANLIAIIDSIFAENLTYIEELLCNFSASEPLHLLLASPGGDGEQAIRIIRLIQSRCSELTVVVPDLAKSAATLVCLGADSILMGPAGDLGPVDAQLQIHPRRLIGAKEIVAAVENAEERIRAAGPDSDVVGLYAALLENVDMLVVEEARSASARDEALILEALQCAGSRTPAEAKRLAKKLNGPLIKESKSHGAVFSGEQAKRLGLPIEIANPQSEQWQMIWQLWVRYFALGCFPAGYTAVYEGRRASQVLHADKQ